jgi:hypothetical protein
LTALKKSGSWRATKTPNGCTTDNDDFIRENGGLWEYLNNRLKALPSYLSDYEEYQKCKLQDCVAAMKNHIEGDIIMVKEKHRALDFLRNISLFGYFSVWPSAY